MVEAWIPWVAPYTDSTEDAKSVSLQPQLALLRTAFLDPLL